MSTAHTTPPWYDMPDDADATPTSWDAITTYVLVTINAMVSLVVVLGITACLLGVL